jgi:hypothetical protein
MPDEHLPASQEELVLDLIVDGVELDLAKTKKPPEAWN